jgi:hypothetical protein
MNLVEQFTDFAVYEHRTGKGVIIAKVKGRGNNGAIFDTVGEALNTALAVMWGKRLNLTHCFIYPPKPFAVETENQAVNNA